MILRWRGKRRVECGCGCKRTVWTRWWTGKAYATYDCGVRDQRDHVTMGNVSGGGPRT